MSEIVFENVSKVFRNNHIALEDISFEIVRGEFVFVIGKSGAGKSTLLNLIMGQLPPTKGEIWVQETPVSKIRKGKLPIYRRKFGVMSSELGLLNDRTVYENVALALRATERPKKTIEKNVNHALGIVGIRGRNDAFPKELSVGQAARVALARALVTNPQILIADEPTANLDSGLAWDMMCLLDEINRMGITVIIATHAKDLVTIMQKRVLTLVEGALIADEKKSGYNYRALDIFEQRRVLKERK